MDIFSHDFTISDADFHRLVQFIQQNYGIDLSKKRQLISSRLSHSLRELGYRISAPFWSICFPPVILRTWSWC